MCDVAWYNEYLGLNPMQRMRRDLIVGYAENHGGTIERYLREVYPRYWQRVDWRDRFDQIGEDLHLTPADEARILADMARAVVPTLRDSFPEGATTPRLPASVGHL